MNDVAESTEFTEPESYPQEYMEQPTGSTGPSEVVLTIVIIQAAIFFSSLFGVFKLWMGVFDFLGNKSTRRAEILASIIGTVEAEGSNDLVKGKIKTTGFIGTLLILAIAVGAMYVVGDHVVI